MIAYEVFLKRTQSITIRKSVMVEATDPAEAAKIALERGGSTEGWSEELGQKVENGEIEIEAVQPVIDMDYAMDKDNP